MNIGRLGLLLVPQMLCAAPSAAQDTVPAAQALLEQFDDMYRSTGTAARIEIKIERPKKVRTMQMRSWSQGEDKALVVIDAPARDAGTATLRVGSNLWNYLPKISRTIRVPPALMMGAWMGSDLTNDDLVRESSYAHDYEITGVGPSEEPPGWQVDLEAKPGVPGLWERVEVVFAHAEQLPVLVRYYDRKGRLSRTMQLEEIKKMGDRLIPTRIAISPEREEGRRTVLTYLHVEFDVELDESLFSLAQLERRR
jgi:outer membrane lipoprotein-sorting protein